MKKALMFVFALVIGLSLTLTGFAAEEKKGATPATPAAPATPATPPEKVEAPKEKPAKPEKKAKKTICLKQTTKTQNPPVLKSEHIGSAMQCHRQRQQQKQMLALVVSRVKSLNFLFTTIWNISLQ